METLATHLARANKPYKSAIDLLYAFAHATLDETIELTGFSSSDKLLLPLEVFMAIKVFKKSSHNKCLFSS